MEIEEEILIKNELSCETKLPPWSEKYLSYASRVLRCTRAVIRSRFFGVKTLSKITRWYQVMSVGGGATHFVFDVVNPSHFFSAPFLFFGEEYWYFLLPHSNVMI